MHLTAAGAMCGTSSKAQSIAAGYAWVGHLGAGWFDPVGAMRGQTMPKRVGWKVGRSEKISIEMRDVGCGVRKGRGTPSGHERRQGPSVAQLRHME